jgi:DNA repair protein RadA/Sms
LAVIAAVASSVHGRPLPDDVVLWGEVGLTGEVRSVARSEARAREAARQGFGRCVLPAGNVRGLRPVDGLRVQGVTALDQLFEVLELA